MAIEYYRVEMLEILYSQLRNGEIMYIVITIMNDLLWKGREGVFALSSMLI